MRFEEVIHRALRSLWPCVGIGGCNDNFGIPKIICADQNWYDVFTTLANDAKLLVFTFSQTEGAMRELEWVKKMRYQDIILLSAANGS